MVDSSSRGLIIATWCLLIICSLSTFSTAPEGWDWNLCNEENMELIVGKNQGVMCGKGAPQPPSATLAWETL